MVLSMRKHYDRETSRIHTIKMSSDIIHAQSFLKIWKKAIDSRIGKAKSVLHYPHRSIATKQ